MVGVVVVVVLAVVIVVVLVVVVVVGGGGGVQVLKVCRKKYGVSGIVLVVMAVLSYRR